MITDQETFSPAVTSIYNVIPFLFLLVNFYLFFKSSPKCTSFLKPSLTVQGLVGFVFSVEIPILGYRFISVYPVS